MPTKYTIDGWMVAWNPKHSTPALDKIRGERPAGSVKIGAWPDESGWSDPYDSTTGCCMTERHNFGLEGKVTQMFIDFHTLVVRDGIDPQAAHKEFLKIDEYCRRISPEVEGAELGDGD